MGTLWWFGCILAFASMSALFFNDKQPIWAAIFLAVLMFGGAGIMYVTYP